MERKNLFDYATKELTQDAFLRWLFENFNNPIIGCASKKLISVLSNLCEENGITPNEIIDVKTYSQINHIDIVVDIFTKSKQYLMIIEDKTKSSQHDDQLGVYKNVVDKWNNDFESKHKYKRITYKIYYKTDFINESEKKIIKNSDWETFDIKQINEFFKSYQNSPDQLLSDYANYVCRLYKKLTEVSNKEITDWDFDEFKAYASKKLAVDYCKKYGSNVRFLSWIYQGKYLSVACYCDCINFVNHAACLEIFFRKGKFITATIHIIRTSKNGNEIWKNTENDPCWKAVYDKYKLILPRFFKPIKFNSEKKKIKQQSVATIIKPIEKTDVDEVTNKLIEIINDFHNYFSNI